MNTKKPTGHKNLWNRLGLGKQDSYGLQTPPAVNEAYRYWRRRIFASIYLGYATFYFTRKSFTFAMPALISDLGYSKADLGILASVLYVSYGFSKFVSGILSDRLNPRYFMAVGLIFTGITNILFGHSSSMLFFILFWGLNGFFQGWGFPPCAKQITYWFGQKERGFWWSILGTSNNLGGALIPLLAVVLIANLGWRWAMYAPGIISIGVGLILLRSLRGTPDTLGLPPIEIYTGELSEASAKKPAHQGPLSTKFLLREVIRIKAVWYLAIACFCIYVVRSGINDWIVVYLNQHKGYSLQAAAQSAFWFELGGFLGCMGAGWGSDYLFNSKRIPYIAACTIGLIAILLLMFLGQTRSIALDTILLTIAGFLIFGPQALIGLASAEVVDKQMACSAYGLTGGIAYLGAAASGYPMGKMIDLFGWDGLFGSLIVACLALILVMLPLLGQDPSEENGSEPYSRDNRAGDLA